MSGSISNQQTVFVLAMLAYTACEFNGDGESIARQTQPELLRRLKQYTPQLGAWDVIWGPAVYVPTGGSKTVNAMFVARQDDLLIVSIAGTNPFSIYNWLVEDFLVVGLVPWGPTAPAAQIARGTHYGLSVLETLTQPSGLPGAGVAVVDFLKSCADVSKITVTGHSLGGALAPVLALRLAEIIAEPNWIGKNKPVIHCQPHAGPTPGDAEFAAYYDRVLGPRTDRLVNACDVVPQAWDQAHLTRIPELYAPRIPACLEVQGLVFTASELTKHDHYTPVCAGAPVLPGQVEPSRISADRGALLNFFNQIPYQHVNAYFELLGVPDMMNPFRVLEAQALGHLREHFPGIAEKIAKQIRF